MDPTENISVTVHGPNDLRVESTPIPVIEDHEVLMRTSEAGICGTDVLFLSKGKMGESIVKSPHIIGHEISAVVIKCGSAVKHLKEGDRVAVQPNIPCHHCDLCLGGKFNLCPDLKCTSIPPIPGFMSKYIKHAAEYCYKLPDNVTQQEGAVVQPLAVALHACDRANVKFGSNVLICGGGSIGLITLLIVKAIGASRVCVTDVVDEKLQLAKKVGADSTLNVRSGKPEELAKEIKELMGGAMPDITIECTGLESSIRLAVFATAPGGKVLIIGLGAPDINVPVVAAAVKEVDILTSIRFPNTFQRAMDMITFGKVDVKPLITHTFKIEEAVKAFETLKSKTSGAIKVLISC